VSKTVVSQSLVKVTLAFENSGVIVEWQTVVLLNQSRMSSRLQPRVKRKVKRRRNPEERRNILEEEKDQERDMMGRDSALVAAGH
jgi:hypothetical protein